MQQKCKILIVEDELITRQALKYIIGLENDTFEIIGEAPNGKEALSMIEKEQPHVLITDIVMPIMNGIELTKLVKFKYPEIYIVVISSYSDFEYVKLTFQYGAFDYILKPQLEPENLLAILHKTSKCLQIECNEMKEDKKAQSEQYSYKGFCVLGCKLNKIPGYRKSKERFLEETLLEKMSTYLKEIPYESTVTEESCLLVLLNFDPYVYPYIEQAAERIAQDFGTHNAGVRLAMSEVFKMPEEKAIKMEEVKALLNKQFYIPIEQLVLKKVPNREQTETKPFSYKKYEERLSKGLYEEAFEIVMEHLSLLSVNRDVSEAELKKMLEHIIYNTLTHLEDNNVKIKEISDNKLQVFNEIGTKKDIESLKEYMANLFKNLLEMLGQDKNVDHKMMCKMYEYIEEHYKEALTLKDLAQVFHLSYSYLSYYFSESSNKGFNEYLNEVRINKAKELLEEGQLSIAVISEQVGYSEQGYFSKVFKKMTTYSPSEYRKIHNT